MNFFDVTLLPEALDFLELIPPKVKDKIVYNMAMASEKKDPKLFKPFVEDIWYFRTKFIGNHYRMFAFWDKSANNNSLVVSTHGIIKKSNKPQASEIQKAINIRKKYFENKK